MQPRSARTGRLRLETKGKNIRPRDTFDAQPSFDAAVGGDLGALNATVAAVFGVIHDDIFPKQFSVNQEGITTVTVDLLQPPTVSLGGSQAFIAEAAKRATNLFSARNVGAAVRYFANNAITVACGAVHVAVGNEKAPPINVSASVTMGAVVTTAQQPNSSDWALTIVLSDATVTVPNEPTLSALLTSVLAPQLLNYLNSSILSGISIPSLSLEGVDFQPPVLSEETGSDNFLVIYSGLAPVVPPDPGAAWPQGTLYIAVDAAALQAVAAHVLPNPNGSWSDDPFSADYNVQLGATLNLTPGSGSQINGTVSVNASCDFTFHTPWIFPNISFGGSVSGSANLGATITAQPNGNSQDIIVTVNSIGGFDLSASIDGIPDFIMDLLEPLLGGLLDLIASAVAGVLSNFPIKVYTLTPISLSFAGLSTYDVVPQNLVLSTIAGPGGLPMATVTCGISVIKA